MPLDEARSIVGRRDLSEHQQQSRIAHAAIVKLLPLLLLLLLCARYRTPEARPRDLTGGGLQPQINSIIIDEPCVHCRVHIPVYDYLVCTYILELPTTIFRNPSKSNLRSSHLFITRDSLHSSDLNFAMG